MKNIKTYENFNASSYDFNADKELNRQILDILKNDIEKYDYDLEVLSYMDGKFATIKLIGDIEDIKNFTKEVIGVDFINKEKYWEKYHFYKDNEVIIWYNNEDDRNNFMFFIKSKGAQDYLISKNTDIALNIQRLTPINKELVKKYGLDHLTDAEELGII